MPAFTTPLREYNHCHDPHTGHFLPAGACEPSAHIVQAEQAQGSVLQGMLARAPQAQLELQIGLMRAMVFLGGHSGRFSDLSDESRPGAVAALGPVKQADRILEKARDDYGGDVAKVADVVRGSIAVDRPEDVAGVVAMVRQLFQVTREKDRFAAPVLGYQDHLFNVRFSNGLSGEIQVHVKGMLHAKETVGHRWYTQMRRKGVDDATYRTLREQSEDLYAGTWARLSGRTRESRGRTVVLRSRGSALPSTRRSLVADGDSHEWGMGPVYR